MYKISCFADEIASPLSEQLDVMEKLNVGWFSLRSIGDTSVLELTDEQIDEIARTIKARGSAFLRSVRPSAKRRSPIQAMRIFARPSVRSK